VRSSPVPASRPPGQEDRHAPRPPLRLDPEAARLIRDEVARAGGREVCFLAAVGEDGAISGARAVARGNRAAVLAAARDVPEGWIMLHNHPSGHLEPSPADLEVAARLHERGLGTGIVDNQARELYVVVEPPRPRVREPLGLEVLEAVASPRGALARVHPGFEDRPGQRAMLRAVGERYNEGGILLVEAGTGTGKSLAYLLPAAAWALQNGERTIVSTSTINLQEQLVGKDLPLVRQLLGEGVRWTLLKGRGNYISIRRALLAVQGARTLFPEDRSRELADLLQWVEQTRDGSLADLAVAPTPEVWEEVKSDPDICLRARCPHFQRCFYQAARRAAAGAELLVVNHHLLFTDVALRRATGNHSESAVLPPYRHVILDEAHNVEDVATSHLGVNLSRAGLFRTLARLDRNGRGILAAIQDVVTAAPVGEAGRGALLQRLDSRIHPALAEARAALELLFETLEAHIPPGESGTLRLGGGVAPRRASGGDGAAEGAHGDHWDGDGDGASHAAQAVGLELWDDLRVRERGEVVLRLFPRLERELAELRERIRLEEGWEVRLEGRLLDLHALERRLAAAAVGIRLVLDPGEGKGNFVRWLEGTRSPRRGVENLLLAAAPLDPGPLLREDLFRRVETAVLTSATLTTRRRFDFVRGRLGLRQGEEGLEEVELRDGEEADALAIHELLVPSPFDYGNQSLLAVPTGLPPLQDPAFQRATARVAAELAGITGGGIFVLFTSHRALRTVAGHLRESGIEGRFPLFVHGESHRSLLLEAFVGSGRGILLGTTSFWEGVDVPGEPLRGLVLQKLPFRVPTEPVTEARTEAIEAAGGNPFWSYLLPLAALRLKQGFGRLIRSGEDRGAVVLLDDRILTRRYGRYLRESLPETLLRKGPWEELRGELTRFYGRT